MTEFEPLDPHPCLKKPLDNLVVTLKRYFVSTEFVICSHRISKWYTMA